MEIKQLREKIDEIDDQLVRLFTQRMELSGQVAAYKKERASNDCSYDGSRCEASRP